MYVEVIQRLLSRSIMLSVERVGGGQAYFRDAVIDRFWSQVNRDVLAQLRWPIEDTLLTFLYRAIKTQFIAR